MGIIANSFIMEQANKKYRIFLSAAEHSADAHCASLIEALQQKQGNIEFVGVGGDKMAGAGCKLLETTVAEAAMAYKAFSKVGKYFKLINKIKRFFKDEKIDLVIVCDSPAFNFHIAKAAKKMGIKTVFYVAPQLWAWAAWRIGKLRRYCDKLCCILPFEENWFRERGIDTTFVSNPLFDGLNTDLTTHIKSYSDFEPATARIALMPGSRPAEIKSLWQPMQKIASRLKTKYPHITFKTVAVDKEKEVVLKAGQIPGFECQYTIGSVTETAKWAHFSIVASGSATLQVAAAACPMVIMYQSSRILWYLVGRWLVMTKYLSLVNILAGKELVPEFMPCFKSIDPIVQSIEQLLEDRNKLTKLSGELIELTEPLKSNASQKVARIVLNMLG